MNEYSKSLLLDVKIDKKSIDTIKSDLNKLSELDLSFDKDNIEKIAGQLKDALEKEAVMSKLEKDIAILRQLGTDESNEAADKLESELKSLTADDDKQAKVDKLKKDFKSMVLGGLTKVGEKFLKSMKTIFTDALSELKDMTQYSYMTNESVRELKLGYGFSSSQAYGYTQALDVMGFESMEDLMYADSKQLELFQKSFEKYTDYYEETMTPEYVEKQMEYQTAMKEFKLDLQHYVIDFFMDNKDTIMQFMELGMDAMTFIVDALGYLIDLFGNDTRSQSSKDRETQSILNSYVSNSKSTNINQTNNFNNVSKSDQTWLQNSTQMAYKQVIEQLNQG